MNYLFLRNTCMNIPILVLGINFKLYEKWKCVNVIMRKKLITHLTISIDFCQIISRKMRVIYLRTDHKHMYR